MHWQTRTHQTESEKIRTCWGLNPGPIAFRARILPLSHTGSHDLSSLSQASQATNFIQFFLFFYVEMAYMLHPSQV